MMYAGWLNYFRRIHEVSRFQMHDRVKRALCLAAVLAAGAALSGLVCVHGTAAGNPAGQQSPDSPRPFEAGEPDVPSAFGEAFLEGEVENNGGFFVRVGDTVYFRIYGQDVLPETALFGEFITTAGRPDTSQMVAFDPETGRLRLVFEDDGYGRIFVSAGGFWLTQREDDGSLDDAVFVSMDGSQKRVYSAEHPVGVSEDGSVVVLEAFPEGQGADLIARIGGEESARAFPDEKESLEFCGISGKEILFLVNDYQENTSDLYSMNAVTARLTKLGRVGDPDEEDYASSVSWPEPKGFETDRKGAVLTFGWYEGTGHFLHKSASFRAVPGKENSLTMTAEDVLDEEPEKEKFSAFFKDTDYSADPHRIIQTAETIGDTVYLITAIAERAPEDDIGWREAYRCLEMEWDRIEKPAQAGKGSGKASGQLRTIMKIVYTE